MLDPRLLIAFQLDISIDVLLVRVLYSTDVNPELIPLFPTEAAQKQNSRHCQPHTSAST